MERTNRIKLKNKKYYSNDEFKKLWADVFGVYYHEQIPRDKRWMYPSPGLNG